MFDSDPWFRRWAGKWYHAEGFPKNILGAGIKLAAEAGRWTPWAAVIALLSYIPYEIVGLPHAQEQYTVFGTFVAIFGILTVADWCNGTIEPAD